MKVAKRANLNAILFAIVFPSIVTLLYFVVLADQTPALQQACYAVLKVIQFAFPAVWVFLILKERFRWARPSWDGVSIAVGVGVLIAGSMLAVALLWLEPAGFFDAGGPTSSPRAQISKKIGDLGIDSFAKYLALTIFYAAFHSLLEEYYWRWFVFRRLREFATVSQAVVVSSLGFMAHHVIVLGVFFGWDSPSTYIFSLGVAVGGAIWAWIYDRSQSIYGPWLSHMLVDAAIFLLGYVLVYG